jgi:hypothetical protein
MYDILCCHLWQPSHWSASCRERTIHYTVYNCRLTLWNWKKFFCPIHFIMFLGFYSKFSQYGSNYLGPFRNRFPLNLFRKLPLVNSLSLNQSEMAIKTVDKNYCINICTEIHENIKTVHKNYCINICTEIHENIKTVGKTIV